MAKFAKWMVWFCVGIGFSLLLVLATSIPGKSAQEISTATFIPTDASSTIGESGIPISQQADLLRNPVPLNRPLPTPEGTPSRPIRSNDPADQVAPPGLNVEPGDAPIPPFMALAMHRELDRLVGRFESAVFFADAVDQPTEVRLDGTSTASADAAEKSVADPALNPVLVEARQLIQDWSGLIEDRAYREARDRWLTVRQNLWQSFPTDRPFAQPEIRAMWLDRGSIVRAGSPAGLARLFDNMQAAGINTVFLETLNAGYPIYPSRIAPQQNPLTRRWDPLEAAVAIAHERNMELHAWMWVFAAGNQRHNAILNLPTDYLGPVLNLHPEWSAYTNEGEPIPRGQTKPFFDPANPRLRSYLLQMVDEIITNYDVDGLQLDYIRYPFQDPGADRTYGYGLEARRQFRRLTGVDPVDLTPRVDPWLPARERERQRSLWDRWTEFRMEQVTTFVADTSKLVRSKRPDITLSTAVFAIPEHERLQKIQQDWNRWAEEGLVDWIVLMSYAQDTNRFEQLIEPWVLEQDYGSTLVIPGIRLLQLSIPAVIDQIQALRDLPAPGYALFATDNLNPQVQSILNSTQGKHDSWVPQSLPFKTAAERFQALQREWNWLLSNGQLGLESKLADDWIQEVNDLGSLLSNLPEAATDRDIAVAQERVNALKQSLGVGMRIETATSREYRLKAWENRLEAISRFLTYGETRQG